MRKLFLHLKGPISNLKSEKPMLDIVVPGHHHNLFHTLRVYIHLKAYNHTKVGANYINQQTNKRKKKERNGVLN